MKTHAAALLRHLEAQAAAASLVAIGRARALFPELAARSPATCDALARALDIDAAWLRDWLDGLVLARIVDHDGAHDTYALPAAMADALEALGPLDDDAVPDGLAHAVAPGARLVELAPDAESALAAAHPNPVVAVVLAAASCVSDNLEHPLGAALYLRSLRRRERGLAGVAGDERVRAAAIGAGYTRVTVEHVDVGGVTWTVLVAHP